MTDIDTTAADRSELEERIDELEERIRDLDGRISGLEGRFNTHEYNHDDNE